MIHTQNDFEYRRCSPKHPGSIRTGVFWKEERRCEEESIENTGLYKEMQISSKPSVKSLLYGHIIAKKVLVVNEQIRIFHTQNDLFLIHLIPGTASLRSCPSYR